MSYYLKITTIIQAEVRVKIKFSLIYFGSNEINFIPAKRAYEQF